MKHAVFVNLSPLKLQSYKSKVYVITHPIGNFILPYHIPCNS